MGLRSCPWGAHPEGGETCPPAVTEVWGPLKAGGAVRVGSPDTHAESEGQRSICPGMGEQRPQHITEASQLLALGAARGWLSAPSAPSPHRPLPSPKRTKCLSQRDRGTEKFPQERSELPKPVLLTSAPVPHIPGCPRPPSRQMP